MLKPLSQRLDILNDNSLYMDKRLRNVEAIQRGQRVVIERLAERDYRKGKPLPPLKIE